MTNNPDASTVVLAAASIFGAIAAIFPPAIATSRTALMLLRGSIHARRAG